MLRASLVVLVLLGLALAAVALLVYRRPLATYGWSRRRALRRTGLRRVVIHSLVGRQVAWVGGKGPLVVLLHGAGDQAAAWAATVPHLVARYRVVVPDLPGHGRSEPNDGPLPFSTILAGTEAVLDSLVADGQATLVGNSLGAWLACVLAARRPARFERLVLVNGGPIPGDRQDISFTPATREEARKTLEALMGPAGTKAPDFVLDDLMRVCRLGPLGRFASTTDSMAPYVLDGRLHEVTVPVDLLWGQDDEVFPPEYARRLMRHLPASRLTLLEGCGHVPHRTNAQRFVTSLVHLLNLPNPEMTGADR